MKFVTDRPLADPLAILIRCLGAKCIVPVPPSIPIGRALYDAACSRQPAGKTRPRGEPRTG
jgi:hypothetical protein